MTPKGSLLGDPLLPVLGFAPGRVNMIGEHTDHTDGLAMPMALEVGVRVSGIPGGDTIRLTSADDEDGGSSEHSSLAADGSYAPNSGWRRYVAAVAHELHQLGRPPVGLTGRVTSDLPQGVGLSSSAALEVAVAVALSRAAAWTVPASDLISACRRAEQRAVGVPSGVLDQAASILCHSGAALVLDCADLSTTPVPLPVGLQVLIVDSGVRRQLESSGYGQRVQELAAALPVLGGRRPADVSVSMFQAHEAELPDVPRRRLRHVVTENQRVRQAAAALLAGDLSVVADLFRASHDSLREDFEVTVPETDALVTLLRDNGALAARMTGGGFGGAVIGLCAGDADSVAEGTVRDYAAAFPGRTPLVLVSTPGAGAAERAPDVIRRLNEPIP